jgi:hypothetical protein
MVGWQEETKQWAYMASNQGLQPGTPYESKPPEWLAKATRDGDLGACSVFTSDVLKPNKL